MVGYVESAAAGEEIRIADQADHPDLADLGPDFWLFDAETPDAFAVLMHYGADNRLARYEHTSSPDALSECRRVQSLAISHSAPLNVYLATTGAGLIGRVA